MAVGVQQQRFVIAQGPHFLAGQNGVQVGSDRFGLGHQGIDVEALEGGGFDPNPVFQPLFAQIGAPRPGGNRYPNGVGPGVQAAVAFADKHQRPDVALFQIVDPDRFQAGLADVLGRKRNFEIQNMGRVKQALNMLGKTEDCRTAVLAGVAPNALEHADAVVEGMGEHMYSGFGPGDKLAVHPDFTVFHAVLLCKKLPANQNT